MLAFVESIIRLLIKLIFVERLAQENEELKKEIQQLKQEKEELAEGKAEVIQQHFSLFQKYITIKQQKELLVEELARYKSAQSDHPCDYCRSAVGLNYSKYPTTKPNELDINQEFNPDDLDVIDQLLRDYNSTEELTI